ncbi:hypothetical protein ElyMa_000244700 [Elysia marginata]|uniref:C-type lectin domain-containing protein n=1 Tax=Elysia marginata TaxID=1093978 RepID=A0AAV4F3R0_9GAST|nr:hypothetical protein ElyMa_000244700 [Elysia marginata]
MYFFIFLLFALAFSGINAAEFNRPCLEARIACFDQWAKVQDCNSTRNYKDCMRRVKLRGVCPQDTVTVEEIYDSSVDCGYTPNRRRHVFPDFDEPQHAGLPRFIDIDGTKMYEFAYNQQSTYDDASKFCSDKGGSLFIPRHHYNIISLDVFLRRQVKMENNGHFFYLGPSKDVDYLFGYGGNKDGHWHVGSKGTDEDKFWVGASDRIREAEFRFDDGSTLAWDFFAPKEGTRDTGFLGGLRRHGQDCVSMDFATLQGYVRDCDKKRPFVCQYRGTPKH